MYRTMNILKWPIFCSQMQLAAEISEAGFGESSTGEDQEDEEEEEVIE